MRRRGKTARSTISGNDFSGGCLPTRGSLPRSLRLDAAADAGRIIRGAVRHNGIAPIALAFGSVGIGPQGPSARRTPQYSSSAGWPRAVARPGLPQIRTCTHESIRLTVTGHPSPRKARFQVLVRLSWAGFHPQGSDKRFPTHVMFVSLLFQASWHNPFLGPTPRAVDGWPVPRLPRNRRRSVPFPGRSGRSLDHRLLQKRELQWPEAWHSSKWANRAGRTGRFHANQGPRRRETRIPL